MGGWVVAGVTGRADRKRSGLGASEVAAVFGEPPPWFRDTDVWLDRMGLSTPRPDNPAMRAGRELERPLLRMGAEAEGVTLRHNRRAIPHPDPTVPLFATPDGLGVHHEVTAEVKLVGRRFADWVEGPPGYVRTQVAAQLACVPRAEGAIIIALIGSELRTYRQPRVPEVEEALIARVREWWATHVLGEVSPDPPDPDAAWRLFGATAAVGEGRSEARLATPDEQRLGAELIVVGRQLAAIEERQDALRRELAETAIVGDVSGVGWRAGWTERAATSWKSVALALGADADLIEAHTARAPSFTFRLARGAS